MVKGICLTTGIMGGFETLQSLGDYLEDRSPYVAHHMQEVFVQSSLIILWDLVLGQSPKPVWGGGGGRGEGSPLETSKQFGNGIIWYHSTPHAQQWGTCLP